MKPHFIKMLAFILSASLLFSCTSCSSRTYDLPLDQFKGSDGEYKLNEIEWTSSLDEVKEALPYGFEEVETPHEREWQYNSKKSFQLDSYSAPMELLFKEDGLFSVQFNFTLNDDYEEWFDTQVERLIKLYGQESEHVEKVFDDNMKNRGYRWDTEKTSLQIVVLLREGHDPICTIHIVDKTR